MTGGHALGAGAQVADREAVLAVAIEAWTEIVDERRFIKDEYATDAARNPLDRGLSGIGPARVSAATAIARAAARLGKLDLDTPHDVLSVLARSKEARLTCIVVGSMLNSYGGYRIRSLDTLLSLAEKDEPVFLLAVGGCLQAFGTAGRAKTLQALEQAMAFLVDAQRAGK
jgi:hypothetical protein